MSEKRPLVIYHAACRDGFAAAWAVSKVMPDAEFHPGFYGQEPPDVRGRRVVLVDFTYPRSVLKGIIATSPSTTIMDHHKTAEADLFGINEELAHMGIGPARIVFDMARSGAGIAWDELIRDAERYCINTDGCGGSNGHYPGCSYLRPWPIDYVEDRDLWRWALPGSRIINAYLGAVPFTFEAWDAAAKLTIAEAVSAGSAVQMKLRQYAEEVGKNAIIFDFEGRSVPLVNAPQCDISELLEHVMDTTGEAFVMGWWQRADKMIQYSLRSRGDLDVSEFAKRHGGGGHKNAAGFQVQRPIHL